MSMIHEKQGESLIHCPCVGPLRRKVARLERQNAALRSIWEKRTAGADREPGTIITRRISRRGAVGLGVVLDLKWCRLHKLKPGSAVDLYWHPGRTDILIIRAKK